MLDFSEAQRAQLYSAQGNVNPAWFEELTDSAAPLDVAACLVDARPDFDGRRSIAKAIDRVRTGMAHAPKESHPLIERAIAARELGGVPTEPLDAEVEAAMVALEFQPVYAAVPYWIAKQGVGFALRAFVRTHGYEHSHYKHNYTAKGDWITESWDACARVEHDESGWKLLRCCAAMLDAAEYQALVALVAELRPHVPLGVRLGMDFVVPTERAWIETDIAEAFANPKAWRGSSRLFITLCNLPDALRAPVLHETYYAEEHLLNVLASHGADEGARVVHAMLTHAPNNDNRKDYIKVLACAVSIAAGNVMAEWLLNKATLPVATKYFTNHPELIESVLVPLIGKGGKLGAAAAVARDTAASKASSKKAGGGKAKASPNAATAGKSGSVANDASIVDDPSHVTLALATNATIFDDNSIPAQLPSVLRNPPWLRPATHSVELNLPMLPYQETYPLTEALRARIALDRTKWAEQRTTDDDWATEAKFVEWVGSRYNLPLFWVAQVEDISLLPTLLQSRRVRRTYNIAGGVRSILQWHGLAALPALLDFADAALEDCMQAFADIDSPRIALTFARALAKKSMRRNAEQWLVAHARLATWGLVPYALATITKKSAADRAAAQSALMLIKQAGHSAIVDEVAALYGAEAARAVAALDPLNDVPSKLPPLPPFALVSELPPLRCADGTEFGAVATERFITMLSFGITATSVYGGIIAACQTAEPTSLHAFLWALFLRWQAAGSPSTTDWALRALGLVGDDAMVRKLVPLIRAWPKEKALARAAIGVDVLGHIGTDLALMSIDALAAESKYDSIRERASETIAAIAAARGLSPDALADRLAPTLNLNSHGTCDLVVGDATYRVGFDAFLQPRVRLLNDTGHVTASASATAALPELPKARKGDTVGAASHVTWKALCRDAKAAAKREIARLERAMISNRSWTHDEFNALLRNHPLMQHLTRRLLWRATVPPAAVAANAANAATALPSAPTAPPSVLFRVAEDRTLADHTDATYQLPATAVITLPHPLRCSPAEITTSQRIFADYEILAPFEQLTRSVLRVPEDANADLRDQLRDQALCDRIDALLPATDLHRLLDLGWRTDGESWCHNIMRNLDSGHDLALHCTPGFAANRESIADQTITSITLLQDNTVALWSVLDDVQFSEVIRELRA